MEQAPNEGTGTAPGPEEVGEGDNPSRDDGNPPPKKKRRGMNKNRGPSYRPDRIRLCHVRLSGHRRVLA